MTPAEAVAAHLAAHLPESAPLGLAVSGGGDSQAMLVLLAENCAGSGRALHAVGVDHGLRPEAAEELGLAAQTAEALGIPFIPLHWTGWTGQGNLQDAARVARRGLLAAWAAEAGIADIAVAHTQDDQAETVLMRLTRGSGVEGLAGMAAVHTAGGLRWHRPLLGVSRRALREVLTARGLGWAEDPSNVDPRFERVRARQFLQQSAEYGLTAARLAETASAMQRAAEALAVRAAEAAGEVVREEGDDLVVDIAALMALERDTRERIASAALQWISGAVYRPRREALTSALEAVRAGRSATLHGCLMLAKGETLWITREYAAVKDLETGPGELWDGRWRLSKAAQGLRVRALGEEGLAILPERPHPAPRPSLLATPAAFDGATPVAVPRLGYGKTDLLTPAPGRRGFQARLLSR